MYLFHRDVYKKSQLVKMQGPTNSGVSGSRDASTTQLQYLRVREHCRRVGRKIVRVRGSRNLL